MLMDSLPVVTWYASKLTTAGICLAFLPLKILISCKFILPEIVAESGDENRLQNLIYTPLTPALRSTHPEVFLVKGVQKICSKFTDDCSFQ